jgi:hypothetical protein
MITKLDFDECDHFELAKRLAYQWYGSLRTYRDALDLVSQQIVSELLPDGATLDHLLSDHPHEDYLREKMCVNVYAGWARRKRTSILFLTKHNAEMELCQQFAKAGIQHGGERDIRQILSMYIISTSPHGESIFEMMSH